MKAHINQFLESQVIRESSSPYASPIVLVRKKDGTLHMCFDYRPLNSKTQKDAFESVAEGRPEGEIRKCALFQPQVRYLGHVISSQGVSTDLKTIKAVADWRHPTHISELRSFLGFASYYRRFVEGFAKLAAALHRLVAELALTKTRKWLGWTLSAAWTPQCEDSFEAV